MVSHYPFPCSTIYQPHKSPFAFSSLCLPSAPRYVCSLFYFQWKEKCLRQMGENKNHSQSSAHLAYSLRHPESALWASSSGAS